MNIEEIVCRIKETENILKNYSFTLKSQELENLENQTIDNNKKNYNELMKILEEKAEYLFDLKKRYNFLYKKLNQNN